MLILYLTLFPIIGFLFAVYIRNKNSSKWWIDLNTTAALRSFLFGSNGSQKAFFENEELTCFHTSTASNSERNTMTSVQSKCSSIMSGDESRLKATLIEWLPADNFTFHQSNHDNNASNNNEPKRLLVLFAWLFAKERHLDKYRKLYMDRGFDVLTIKVNVRDFLIPQSGSQQIAAYIARFLGERSDKYCAYIFHAFSVGAYQMGELFVLLGKDDYKQTQKLMRHMLKGIIYDSALDVREAPLGLSKATTNNVFLQWAIITLMNAHLRLCYHISTRHYIRSSRAIRANKFGCPTLVFLSKDDEVANHVHQFEIIDKWRQDGVAVTAKCWDQSPHVSHFFKHPEEYRSSLDNFLKNTIKIL